jgi:hypothetical protein
MWRTYRTRCMASSLWCVLVLTCAATALTSCQGTENGAPQANVTKPAGPAEDEERPSIRVEHGTDTAAKKYYEETFAALGVPAAAVNIDKGQPGMAVMLTYLGYPDLKPSELEDTPSADLMKRFGDDLLASAFFAPKITDVSVKGPDDINVGWRKVIRLRARAGSDAAKHGIAAGFLLFNKFQGKNHSLDPFEPRADHSNESKTTQLILVRAEKGTGADPAQRPIHFFVFGPASDEAKLKLALQASFDAAAPEVEAGLPSPVKDYFVPIACGQCHGGLKFNEAGDKEVDFARQKVNFLDTDHWFDRVQDGDDFAFTRKERFGVLFDGEPDETTAKFAAAFDVLRRLNTEIRSQNEMVELDPSKPTFQLRAITKWLQLHPAGDNAHKDVFARALPPLAGAVPAWDAATEPDRQLLPLMNRFCYRCHSSIIYGVFDRNEVACRKGPIKRFLDLPHDKPKAMPQDRILDPAVKTTLQDLVAGLPDAKCNK